MHQPKGCKVFGRINMNVFAKKLISGIKKAPILQCIMNLTFWKPLFLS